MMKKTNKFLIILWFTLFIFSEILLLFNMIINIKATNWYIYVINFILIGIMFLPIAVISIKRKSDKKTKVIGIILEAFFAILIFVSVAEAAIDKDGTVKQVNNFLDFVTGSNKTNNAPSSFVIEIINEKAEYKINDEIEYKVLVNEKEADIALACDYNNEYYSVDIVNKKIKCLANNNDYLKFYSVIDNSVFYEIKLNVNSKLIEDIKFNEDKKDIFLDINESYQLNNPIIIPTDAEIIEYKYTSSNKNVAIVNNEGLIEAVGYGNTVIKVTAGEAYDSIYVCVGENKKLEITSDKVSIYAGYDNYKWVVIEVDNIKSIDKKCIKYNYNSKYNLKIINGVFNPDNYFTIGIYHNYTNLLAPVEFELEIIYQYKGGTKISDTIIIELLPYDDITIDDIDENKTNLNIDADIYYDDNNKLITKYIDNNIYYKSIDKLNTNNYKYECEGLDLSDSSYNRLIIDLNNSNINDTNYIIKFYPSKNNDNYIEFNLSINIVKLSNDLNALDFEFDNLYSKDENKANEIFFKYFDAMLFSNISYNENYYNNTGVILELDDLSKEYVDLEINEFGIITKLELKKYLEREIPKECQIKLYATSIYDNNIKKEYVINIINQYDDLIVYLNGDICEDNCNIELYENDTFDLTFDYILDLDYKGDFQKNIKPISNLVVLNSANDNIVSWNEYTIKAEKKGYTTLNVGLYSNIYKETFDIKINIIVDGPSDSIANIITNTEILEFNSNCIPHLENGYCSVGTKIRFYVDNSDNFIFKSSDESILKIEDGIATTLKAGSVSIITQYKKDPSVNSEIKLKVYDVVFPLKINQGEFNNLKFDGEKYSVNARTGKQYKIKFDIDSDNINQTISYECSNENIEIGEDGSIAAKKAGKYKVTIFIGEEDSPYKEKLTLNIVVTDTGFSSSFVYFIRKLVGHFGVFMFTAIFGLISMFLMLSSNKNIKEKLIILICVFIYGILTAFTTELIQYVTPGRTFYLGDVWLDLFGYFVGLILVVIVYYIILGIRKIKNRNL